jgi:hypothetical protein
MGLELRLPQELHMVLALLTLCKWLFMVELLEVAP